MDINCDMGESFGHFKIGNDEKIFPYISSCNIACGFHAGDPLHMENTIKIALAFGVQIGAHPSYPDLVGFGRRKMKIERTELKACIKYQVAALKGMVESQGGKLAYVKPHGALYNTAANDESESLAIIHAIREIDDELMLMGLADSVTQEVAKRENTPFICEAFADRKYDDNGRLLSRAKKGAVLEKAEDVVEQVLSLVLYQRVESISGKSIHVKADSICIHGDNPAAVSILQAIQEAFRGNGIIRKDFLR